MYNTVLPLTPILYSVGSNQGPGVICGRAVLLRWEMGEGRREIALDTRYSICR